MAGSRRAGNAGTSTIRAPRRLAFEAGVELLKSSFESLPLVSLTVQGLTSLK